MSAKIILRSMVALLAASPVSALAQGGPYKLIITWHQSNVTVIDYPSQARCEAARRAVEAEVARRSSNARAAMPPGSVVLGASPNGAFCIPG